MKTYVGADISARWFDMCILRDGKPIRRRCENSRKGLRDCILWLESLGIQKIELALEPTGRYGELVAEYFYRLRHTVYQVQPLKFHRYAESVDIRGKSDEKDAYALAMYCKERGEQLREWKPKTEVELELRDLQVLIRSLSKRSVMLQCQLECRLRSQYVIEELQRELGGCEKRIQEALSHAIDLIKNHEVLSRDFELLLTIKGIAETTAVLLLTLIDFRSFKSSRSLACFLGLTKKKNESGATITGHEGISKRGSKWIRGRLFMPARAARQWNPAIREFAERQLSKGKHDWNIQAAVIRKLVTTAWAVVVNRVPFDPNYVNPNRPT